MDKFEEFGRRIDEEFARIKSIKNFKDFGKRVDEELARVKSFVKEEAAPETEKRAAQFLREVSEKLTERRRGSKHAMPRAMRGTISVLRPRRIRHLHDAGGPLKSSPETGSV